MDTAHPSIRTAVEALVSSFCQTRPTSAVVPPAHKATTTLAVLSTHNQSGHGIRTDQAITLSQSPSPKEHGLVSEQQHQSLSFAAQPVSLETEDEVLVLWLSWSFLYWQMYPFFPWCPIANPFSLFHSPGDTEGMAKLKARWFSMPHCPMLGWLPRLLHLRKIIVERIYYQYGCTQPNILPDGWKMYFSHFKL